MHHNQSSKQFFNQGCTIEFRNAFFEFYQKVYKNPTYYSFFQFFHFLEIGYLEHFIVPSIISLLICQQRCRFSLWWQYALIGKSVIEYTQIPTYIIHGITIGMGYHLLLQFFLFPEYFDHKQYCTEICIFLLQ